MIVFCFFLILLSLQVNAFGSLQRSQVSSFLNIRSRQSNLRHRHFALNSSAELIPDDTPKEFDDRFERWKFMQNILEGDADADLANHALFLVLDRAIRNLNEGKQTEDSPEITSVLQERIERVLAASERSRVLILGEAEDISMYNAIQSILPDPVEDEDANKSSWDVVMQLHGMEMVKISENNPTYEWTMSCSLVRLLLQYDFLENGIAP